MKSNVLGDKESEDRGPEMLKVNKKVLERDHYTCTVCGAFNTRLEVHHESAFAFFSHHDDRYGEHNCVTLCASCHASFHKTYSYNGKTTYFEFKNWLEMRRFFIKILSA